MGRSIFLTGRPGVGKTIVLTRIVNLLKIRGYKVGGMLSSELREHGARKGFEIVDIGTGRKGQLAHVDRYVGPKIGKYRVNLHDLKTVGVDSIFEALEKAEVIVVDEIGPMELLSSKFREAVKSAIESEKPVIGTIHYRAHDTLIDMIKRTDNVEILELTLENRENLHEVLSGKIILFLKLNLE